PQHEQRSSPRMPSRLPTSSLQSFSFRVHSIVKREFPSASFQLDSCRHIIRTTKLTRIYAPFDTSAN
ncbi:hypothetical protein, partial [Burkholderia ubonensis]|uniref:hypothetical protein n=1 Tax=Burkholderia ubonensis TaxID=101571 RepID=UPI001C895297